MRRKNNYHWHSELLQYSTSTVGPADDASVDEVLMLPASLPVWPDPDPLYGHARAHAIVRGARQLLQWLLEHPGEGWQDRWLAAAAPTGMGWVDLLIARDPRTRDKCRDELVSGLSHLLLARVVIHSYDFLVAFRADSLFGKLRLVARPTCSRVPR
jgi:hypothetical protein